MLTRSSSQSVVEAYIPLIQSKQLEPVVVSVEAKARVERVERRKIERDFEKLRNQQTGRGGLLQFVRYFWHTLEPKSRPMVEGWPLEAICNHLEALTFGEIESNRLLINVPPGFMKSLLVDVFWPAWEWGPCSMPHLRYVAFSYSDGITTRDNNKMIRLVQSPSYRQLWGERFEMLKLGERRIENDKTGYKVATSVGGLATGERGDRILLDDLVIVMQRLHENDVSGDILAREANYCHMMIPMYFDPLRYPASDDGLRTEDPETGEEFGGNQIGWVDPQAQDADGNMLLPRELAELEGEPAWPDRYSDEQIKGFNGLGDVVTVGDGLYYIGDCFQNGLLYARSVTVRHQMKITQ
jgi:hypothetical protein